MHPPKTVWSSGIGGLSGVRFCGEVASIPLCIKKQPVLQTIRNERQIAAMKSNLTNYPQLDGNMHMMMYVNVKTISIPKLY